MPANVESCFVVGAPAWHRIGRVIPQEVPSGEAICLAGLDWKVTKEQIFASDGTEAIGYRALVRDSDRRVLSVQSESYSVFQNADLFAFGDALVGTKQARYHTAGSLDGGRRVWALLKADGIVRVGHEDVEKYLMLATSHDGSLAFISAFTPVRVVCQNTLNVALATAKICDKVVIRHVGNLAGRVEQARRILGLADVYFERFGDLAGAMLRAPYSDSQVGELVTDLFPSEEDEASTRTKERRDNVIRLFTEGKGHDKIVGTAWAAYNAVAEHTDHAVKGRRTERLSADESRFNSVLFGTGAGLKQRALAKITAQTGLCLAA